MICKIFFFVLITKIFCEKEHFACPDDLNFCTNNNNSCESSMTSHYHQTQCGEKIPEYEPSLIKICNFCDLIKFIIQSGHMDLTDSTWQLYLK